MCEVPPGCGWQRLVDIAALAWYRFPVISLLLYLKSPLVATYFPGSSPDRFPLRFRYSVRSKNGSKMASRHALPTLQGWSLGGSGEGQASQEYAQCLVSFFSYNLPDASKKIIVM